MGLRQLVGLNIPHEASMQWERQKDWKSRRRESSGPAGVATINIRTHEKYHQFMLSPDVIINSMSGWSSIPVQNDDKTYLNRRSWDELQPIYTRANHTSTVSRLSTSMARVHSWLRHHVLPRTQLHASSVLQHFQRKLTRFTALSCFQVLSSLVHLLTQAGDLGPDSNGRLPRILI